jgi:hypothetical protein
MEMGKVRNPYGQLRLTSSQSEPLLLVEESLFSGISLPQIHNLISVHLMVTN